MSPEQINEVGRKHPAHFPVTERHNTPVIIFVTVCTKERKRILANDEAHKVICGAWQICPTWLVGRYVIMPDHIHLFCAPAKMPPSAVTIWVSFWKSASARKWPNHRDAPIWQRHFWDTQLRRGENYEEKWQYVLENPVRAGLATQPEDWPYQGELNVLAW